MNANFAANVAAIVALLACGAAQAVTPPPLPPGSTMVNVQGGLSKPEADRAMRAHHHKFHYQKDYTRDDTIFGEPTSAPGVTGAGGMPVSAPSVAVPGTPPAIARAPILCAPASAAPAAGTRAGDIAAALPRPGDAAAAQAKAAPGSLPTPAVAVPGCDVRNTAATPALKTTPVPKPSPSTKTPAAATASGRNS